MMKKAKLCLLFVPVLSAIILSSCGGTSGGGGGGGDEEGTVTLNVATMSGSEEVTTMNNFINNYKKLPGKEKVNFKIIKITNYDDYIYNSFMYKDLPDIIPVFDYSCEYYTNVVQDKEGNTLLQPLSSYMTRDGINEDIFFESILDITKCKDGSEEMYWVPRDYNKVVCAYNKYIFDAAGIAYPTDNWTWEDFVSVCNKLKKSFKDSNAIKTYTKSSTFYPVDINMNFPAVYYPILKSYGIELVDKETRTCFGGKTEEAKTVWGKLLSLIDDGLANDIVSKIPFTNKQAAMMFIVRPNLPNYVKGLGETAIDFVTMPKYTDLPTGKTVSYVGMGCSGYGMTTACTDNKKDAAWDFLKYIISEEGQNVFSEIGSGIPCLKALATSEDAVFKKYLVTDSYHPNHNAFVAEPERDIRMDYLNGFEVEKHIDITKYIKDRTLYQIYKAKDRDAYYENYKSLMEKIWAN